MISEGKIGAIALAATTCLGVTMVVGSMIGNYTTAFQVVFPIALPIALVMGVVMFFMASDDIKKGGRKPPENK